MVAISEKYEGIHKVLFMSSYSCMSSIVIFFLFHHCYLKTVCGQLCPVNITKTIFNQGAILSKEFELSVSYAVAMSPFLSKSGFIQKGKNKIP